MFNHFREIKEQIKAYYQYKATINIYDEFITICLKKGYGTPIADLKILINELNIGLELYRKLFPDLTLDEETLTELENEIWETIKDQFYKLYLTP